MLERGTLAAGDQSRLAEHFSLSRQRVNQLAAEARRALESERKRSA
jgi:DNA-binding transcriptional regulator YdaS (Cro superfamily)